MIELECEQCGYIVRNLDAPKGTPTEERERFIQTDWDFPGIAQAFGWDMREVQPKLDPDDFETDAEYEAAAAKLPRCDHDTTDGTVRCKGCGLDASAFISAAQDFLDSNDGTTADDPGYF
jgi:hypothetical protein